MKKYGFYSVVVYAMMLFVMGFCFAAQDVSEQRTDEILELAVQDIWQQFSDVLQEKIEKNEIQRYATRENFLKNVVQSAIKKSMHSKQLAPVRDILEHVLTSFAVYGNKTLQAELQLVRFADQATRDAVDAPLVEFYFEEISKALQQCAAIGTGEAYFQLTQAIIQLNDDLLSNRDQLSPALMEKWQDFRTKFDDFLYIHLSINDQNSPVIINAIQARMQRVASLNILGKRFEVGSHADNVMGRLRAAEKFLFDPESGLDLDWCGCDAAPFEKRIVLIIRMIQDTLKQHPDRKKQLVYTSLATGKLLMDFLIVKELTRQGYKNIDINLVDFGYKDAFEINATLDTLERLGSQEDSAALDLQDTLANELESSVAKAVFKKAVGAQFVWSKNDVQRKVLRAAKGVNGIQISAWDNVRMTMYNLCKKNPAYKADVLMLVDAGGIAKVSYASQANAVALVSVGYGHADVQMEAKEAHEQSEIKSAEQYDATWGSEGLFATNKVIYIPWTQCHPLVVYSNMDDEHEVRLLQAILARNPQGTKDFSVIKKVAAIFKQRGFDIVWVSDAYIAFEHIACAAVQKDVLLYTLDAVDKEGSSMSKMERLSLKQYLQKKQFIDAGMHRELIDDFGYRRY